MNSGWSLSLIERKKLKKDGGIKGRFKYGFAPTPYNPEFEIQNSESRIENLEFRI